MAEEFNDNLEKVDQEIRINKLKNEARDLGGGEMIEGKVSGNLPPDIEEQFWQRVVDFENSPSTTSADMLAREGCDLPPPDELDDDGIKAKLWELIQRLAKMRTFITSTNHLSDRELYEHLWKESLREETPDMPMGPNSAWHIDILGACTEEDLLLHYKYYASEEDRRRWQKEFPGFEMPAHVDPPYDRDRFLPQAVYPNPNEGDLNESE